MDKTVVLTVADVPKTHKNDHKDYEYFCQKLVGRGVGGCTVMQYEVPPGKAPFPYHYHAKNEESFYILSGCGLLKTVDGEREVQAGDFLYFPAGPGGAHKLTNTSDKDLLVYIDFDTEHDLEVTVYPDSDKVAIWGQGFNTMYPQNQAVDYYEGE